MNQQPDQDFLMEEERLTQKRALKRTFSRLGWAAFALMLITQGLAAAASVAVVALAPQWTGSHWFVWLLSYLPLYLVAFPIFWLMVKRMPARRPGGGQKLSSGQIARLVLFCLGLTYALNFVSLLMNFLIGLLKGAPVVNPLAQIVTDPLSTFLFAGLVAPVMEELVFRKILLDRMLPHGETFAVYGTAFVFALFHANLSQLLYAFVLGAIFALVTLRTGSIRLSVLLHIIINNIGAFLVPYVLGFFSDAAAGMLAYIIAGGFILLGAAMWPALPKDRPAPSPQPMTPGEKRRAFLLNPGMLAYSVLILILVVMVTLV